MSAQRQEIVGIPHHPAKGEPGYDTWLNGSADYTAIPGVDRDDRRSCGRACLSAGGNRRPPISSAAKHPGNNLYANSLVAVDLKTGKMKWFFQFIHHEVWDYDMSSAPLLMDITVKGKPVKAVAEPTKQGMLYVFDRITGKPIWPIRRSLRPRATCRANGMPHPAHPVQARRLFAHRRRRE